MPALNFQSRFVHPIREGVKHHTIRANRKVPIKAGDKLYLYCGLRHKGAFRILPKAQPCSKVQGIRIEEELGGTRITIDGTVLAWDEVEQLARADGFASASEFFDFWAKHHGQKNRHGGTFVDFTGQIIHWTPND